MAGIKNNLKIMSDDQLDPVDPIVGESEDELDADGMPIKKPPTDDGEEEDSETM